jgi:hypothetical protein
MLTPSRVSLRRWGWCCLKDVFLSLRLGCTYFRRRLKPGYLMAPRGSGRFLYPAGEHDQLSALLWRDPRRLFTESVRCVELNYLRH